MPDDAADRELESFLQYLSASRGFDFTAYKRGTVTRRVQKRMQEVGAASYREYMEYLELNPGEFVELFNTILINVTGFFRDPPVWEYIAKDVIPSILEHKSANEQIRIWSAGCASGEEAYTIAMLLGEAMPAEEFQQRVKIYGTDIDEDALATARRAEYPARALDAVPEELREKYFEAQDGGFAFRKDLRRQVIFGRLNLIQDAPISRVDLLACRNTLMYLQAEAQSRVITRFVFALADGGYLVLGKAETPLTSASILTPINLKMRIFTKAPGAADRTRRVPEQPTRDGEVPVQPPAMSATDLRGMAFETHPVAQLTVDANGRVSSINDVARSTFGLRETDVSRPLQDLQISYKPIDLRSLIETSLRERRSALAPDVEWTDPSGERHWVAIQATPLVEDGAAHGVSVAFIDHTSEKDLQRQVVQLRSELETAYEELQSSNEELETTNEELQSTVEELETTNEELQSTNAELETMNEELQSTNTELETVNREIRTRGEELVRANSFLQTILTELEMGVAVVNRDYVVEAWNHAAEELWGLRQNEAIGAHFLGLDIGLPVIELKQALRQCIGGDAGRAEIQVKATNRRGREIDCLVTCLPFKVDGKNPAAVLLMEPSPVARGD